MTVSFLGSTSDIWIQFPSILSNGRRPDKGATYQGRGLGIRKISREQNEAQGVLVNTEKLALKYPDPRRQE